MSMSIFLSFHGVHCINSKVDTHNGKRDVTSFSTVLWIFVWTLAFTRTCHVYRHIGWHVKVIVHKMSLKSSIGILIICCILFDQKLTNIACKIQYAIWFCSLYMKKPPVPTYQTAFVRQGKYRTIKCVFITICQRSWQEKYGTPHSIKTKSRWSHQSQYRASQELYISQKTWSLGVPMKWKIWRLYATMAVCIYAVVTFYTIFLTNQSGSEYCSSKWWVQKRLRGQIDPLMCIPWTSLTGFFIKGKIIVII